jgi:UTP--glucose-1-phosphate uridylyltransferase
MAIGTRIRPVRIRITDAVIPVGGLGTRLLPATRSQPKEMLPVLDKPVVQYVVEELAAAGIERVLFVTGRRKRAIEDHFDADPELGTEPLAPLEILYTRQARPAGLGDAVRHATGFAGERGAVVALGDTIIGPGATIVRRLVDAMQQDGVDAALAVQEVAPQDVSRYGIVVPAPGGGGEVADVIEKPAAGVTDSRLAIAARYALGPAVFAALRETGPDAHGEVQLADALRALIERGGRVVAVPLAGGERRHDIGTVESYCSVFLEHALNDPRVGPALRAQAAALIDGHTARDRTIAG